MAVPDHEGTFGPFRLYYDTDGNPFFAARNITYWIDPDKPEDYGPLSDGERPDPTPAPENRVATLADIDIDPDQPLDYLTFRDTADETLWKVEITSGAWAFTEIVGGALLTEAGDTLTTEGGDALWTES